MDLYSSCQQTFYLKSRHGRIHGRTVQRDNEKGKWPPSDDIFRYLATSILRLQ